MNKYIWCECPEDVWPYFRTILAKSYNDAVEKVINLYGESFEDDAIFKFEEWKELREYLNDNYTVALSDLEDYEEV